jgi:hypothetical protein
MSKKMPAPFKLPEDKMLRLNELKGKARPLVDHLKLGAKQPHARKDLDPKWDAAF